MSAFRVLLAMIFTIILILTLGFIDYKVITPLVPLLVPLPEDICYYHLNTPPLWIDLFYLDNTGHIEPPYRLHVILILLSSVLLGIYAAIKVDKWLLKRDKTNETKN